MANMDNTTSSMTAYHNAYDLYRYEEISHYCEAQGKGRAKGPTRKVTQRSFIDGGWWMVDILSQKLYTKFG